MDQETATFHAVYPVLPVDRHELYGHHPGNRRHRDKYTRLPRFAAIHTAGELNTAVSGGTITTLAWNSSIASNIVGPTIIYLKAVGTTTTVASDSWDNTINGATSVYTGTPGPWGVGWNTIDITDFPIAAGQNIEVMIECNFTGTGSGGSSATSFYYTNAGSNNFAY